MGMTVKELIKELRKYPQSSIVGIRAHDNDESELQGIVADVHDFWPENSFDPEYCKNVFVVIEIG